MRYVWSRFVLIFLGMQTVAFLLYYNFGPRGIQALYDLQKVKNMIQVDMQRVKQDNQSLQEQIEAWKKESFLQEKFAREKLTMQKENETIFFR